MRSWRLKKVLIAQHTREPCTRVEGCLPGCIVFEVLETLFLVVFSKIDQYYCPALQERRDERVNGLLLRTTLGDPYRIRKVNVKIRAFLCLVKRKGANGR